MLDKLKGELGWSSVDIRKFMNAYEKIFSATLLEHGSVRMTDVGLIKVQTARRDRYGVYSKVILSMSCYPKMAQMISTYHREEGTLVRTKK